jgi:hypothetical protein
MDTSLILSTQGLFLTLGSLLGTFFYVHLSNWLREVIAIQNKWNLNKNGEKDEEKQALRECRYALQGVYNYVPGLVSGIITAFVFLLAALSISLWTWYSGPDVLQSYLSIAGLTFLILYTGLTACFLIHGYCIGHSIQSAIYKKYPKSVQ